MKVLSAILYILCLSFFISCEEEQITVDDSMKTDCHKENFACYSKVVVPDHPKFGALLGVGGYLDIESIPVDQKKKVFKTHSFSETLGKSLSSVPGNLNLDFGAFTVSADDIDQESVKYMRIDKVELNLKDGKGSLAFFKSVDIFLIDPNDKMKKAKKVLTYNKKAYAKKCGSSSKCYKRLVIDFDELNLVDYLTINDVNKDSSDGGKQKFSFQDFKLKMNLQLDTPKYQKFEIIPRIHFSVGLKLNNH